MAVAVAVAVVWPAATALIRLLAWEPPYASGVALEKTKQNKNKTLYLNANNVTIKLLTRERNLTKCFLPFLCRVTKKNNS